MSKLKNWLSRGSATAQLGAGLGAEVVDVVERMHGSISQAPLPFSKLDDESTRGITGLVYRCVKGSFEACHLGLRKLAESLADPDDQDPHWLAVRASINGVCGDSLEQRGNPLAQQMQLNETMPREGSDTLLIYIHGLCMSDLGWRDGVHAKATEALAERLNARVAYLRYNTGKHISENGEAFSGLLEQAAKTDTNIVIIGHSMGGLITRSACHYAEQSGASWLAKLTHVATLGTPHNGAPAERLGSFANSLLTHSPYTNPLSRLGGLRSAGIRDLRFGNLLHSDWQGVENPEQPDDLRTPVALPQHIQWLLLAGTRSEFLTDNPLDAKHDLLVTVASAWAQADNADFTLQGDNINRVLLSATDHMRLMWSCEVYDEINAWLDDLAD